MAQIPIDRRDFALMDHIRRHGPISVLEALTLTPAGTPKTLFSVLEKSGQVTEFTPPGGSVKLYRLTDFGVATVDRILAGSMTPEFRCPHCKHVESTLTSGTNIDGNLVCWACRLHHLDSKDVQAGTGQCRYCGPVKLAKTPGSGALACPTGRATKRLAARGRVMGVTRAARQLRDALDLFLAQGELTPGDRRILAAAYEPVDRFARKSDRDEKSA